MDEPSRLVELAAAIDDFAGTFNQVWERAHQTPTTQVPATQMRVLFIVERRGSVNVSGLAAELEASVPSASRLCDRLQAGGLLVRDPGPNRREITVRLSRDGQSLLDEVRRARREELERVLAAMSPGSRTALLTGLAHFHAATGLGRANEASDSVSRPA
ncbi:MarR family winged helix-turn-helix transcriptional regulator [Actinomadura sp. HBU206391]|uniref:MarR family winged helix-turn-helix transcriptional regulator n=1 Tax=Actinomadura sp. HBU206391 TaxID=2731692 RepID=UPI0021C5B01B|nr:MarR family transcriptional regulator [Actinomadura sp. HBU206391]